MQLTILAQLHGWTDNEKATRLTAELRGEAQLLNFLLNLSPDCLGSYQSLSEALARWFGSLSDPEGVKLQLRRRLHRKGESLARWASLYIATRGNCEPVDQYHMEEEELPFQMIGRLRTDGKALGSCFPPRNCCRRITARTFNAGGRRAGAGVPV
ncbi:UNVERIFIED_CONTAM: hypothetical protein FKN15_046513 [Acipenser sinensis]